MIQIFAPFVIYWSLIHCRGCCKTTSASSAEADKNEENAMAERYKKQLGEVESRTTKPENAITIQELQRIKQQLDNEVDQLRATRRLRDREQQKTAKLWRIVSLYYYVSFWLWMIYLIICSEAQLGEYAVLFSALAIVAIIGIIALPMVFWVESWFSSERHYIKNLGSLTLATDRIESIRNTQPAVFMNAECYHFEMRTRTVTYYVNGQAQNSVQTYLEKVVSNFIVAPFRFTHWLDCSQSTLTDVRKAGITKIKMELTVLCGDQATAELFRQLFQRFQDENRHRDDFVNFFVSKNVDGFEKRLAAITDASKIPGWISSTWFWVSTAFCLGWPYRIAFNRAVGKTDYNVVKVIYISDPSVPAAPTAAPQPRSEEDIISDLQKSIKVTLDRLNAGLSESDGDAPITCAATDQHMNVPLREAHHVR